MNKQDFIEQLKNGLSGLPEEDVKERLSFYSEMIDDRIEDGIPEETAVGDIGNIDDIVKQIIADIPFSRLVKEKITPKEKFKIWEIILIILGSPIWLSLLIAFLAVILSIYVSLWTLIVALWAGFVSLIACGVSGIAAGVYFVIENYILTALAIIGAGIVCAGFSIFMFYGCKYATKGILILTKKLALTIKSSFLNRGQCNE